MSSRQTVKAPCEMISRKRPPPVTIRREKSSSASGEMMLSAESRQILREKWKCGSVRALRAEGR